MLGHIFPFYMKFRGGKGQRAGGALLAYSPWVFLIALLVEASAIAFSIDYICVVPISASVVLPILYGIIERDIIGMLFLMSVGAIIIWRHKENIIRIKNSTELHLSFIWDKEKELERQKQFIKSDELL